MQALFLRQAAPQHQRYNGRKAQMGQPGINNITGATTATLSFTPSMADNNKQYRAAWTNIGGPVNSNPAILTVNPIPVLSSDLSGTATSGTAFTYTPTSTIPGTTFTWGRAAIAGISNTAEQWNRQYQ